jgi:4-hydroxythreonine-4-phosphate dehydrogenase
VTQNVNSENKPRIGITIGDVAGIGPEIVLKAVADTGLSALARLVIIGDAAELRRQANHFHLSVNYPIINDNELCRYADADVVICEVGAIPEPIQFGNLSATTGQAAIDFITAGANLCLRGELDAIATAPINKEALKLAGSPYPGHTEMLTALCGASRSLMCFFAGELRVVLLTIHVSLADAIRAITKERVIEAAELTHSEMQRFGIAAPRLALAGLNPHASEHGLFGNEEQAQMQPAVEYCRRKLGINLSGPFPADTLFVRAARGEFDAVLACYHDQGLIAVKCLAFGEAVNVTLGLPIIRTSVDHGTAFDIAGCGIAEHGSMVAAIKLAAKLAEEVKSKK